MPPLIIAIINDFFNYLIYYKLKQRLLREDKSLFCEKRFIHKQEYVFINVEKDGREGFRENRYNKSLTFLVGKVSSG